MCTEKSSTLLALSAKLPSGLNDPKSLVKFEREFAELKEELRKGDRVGALLEAADCMYYAEKSLVPALVTPEEKLLLLRRVVKTSGFDLSTIHFAAIAKYTLRARPGNPKNDAEERAAVAHLI